MSNSNLFSFIPALITALAGLLTAIVGVFPILGTARKTQDKVISASSEHISLEFLKMERMPLDQAVWLILKNNSKLLAVVSSCFVMLITIGVISAIIRFDLVPGSFSTEPLHLVFGFLALAVLIINFVIYLYLFFISFFFYIIAGKQPEDARHHLFQETKIEVRADYKDVFSRCREALQNMSMQRIEYDFGAGALVLQRDFTSAVPATGPGVACDGSNRQRTCVAADKRSAPTLQADLARVAAASPARASAPERR